MPKSSVAIGVIGAGIMGERLLTAILQQKPDLLQACGIWDPAPAAMQRMAKTFPQVPRLADAAAIIAASDCVYVASPPASHLGHARAALAAGKSFFGEKPLAVDVADARAFVAEAGDRGAINFPFASSPGQERKERGHWTSLFSFLLVPVRPDTLVCDEPAAK